METLLTIIAGPLMAIGATAAAVALCCVVRVLILFGNLVNFLTIENQ